MTNQCPKCGAERKSGIECPSCGIIYFKYEKKLELQKEKELIDNKEETLSKDQYVKCPYCAEDILAAAIKCKHCGEMLNFDKSKILPKSTQTPDKDKTEEEKKKKKQQAQKGCGIGCLSVIAIFFIFYLIGSLSSSNSPNSTGEDEKKAYKLVCSYGPKGYTISNQIDALIGISRSLGKHCEVSTEMPQFVSPGVYEVKIFISVSGEGKYEYRWESNLNSRTVIPLNDLAKKLSH